MKKDSILKILAGIAALLTFLGGLDLSGIVSVMPDAVATGLATALPLFAGIVHIVRGVGDLIDDRQINGSFKCAPLAFLAAIVFALLMSSCGVVGQLTGNPGPTVPVQRVTGPSKPFAVAEADVIRAESSQPTERFGLVSLTNIGRVVTVGK